MQVDWGKFLDLGYWFEGVAGESSTTPVISPSSDFFWFFLYLFSFLAITGIIFNLIKAFLDIYHPLQSKLSIWGNNFILMGLLGFFWFTLRELSVGFFGARFWLVFGLVWFLYILFTAVKYFLTYFTLEMAYYQKEYKSKKD